MTIDAATSAVELGSFRAAHCMSDIIITGRYQGMLYQSPKQTMDYVHGRRTPPRAFKITNMVATAYV